MLCHSLRLRDRDWLTEGSTDADLDMDWLRLWLRDCSREGGGGGITSASCLTLRTISYPYGNWLRDCDFDWLPDRN